MLLGLLSNNGTATPPSSAIVIPPSGTFIGLGVESTYGSGASPVVFLPAEAFSFSDDADRVLVPWLINNRVPESLLNAHVGYSGTISIPLVNAGIGDLLTCVMGTSIPTAVPQSGGFNTYTFTPGNLTNNSLGFFTNIDDIYYHARLGGLVDGLSISAAFGDYVHSDWSIVGSTSEVGDLTVVSPVWHSVNPINFSDVSVSKDGVDLTGLMSFEFSISNSFTPYAILRKDTTPKHFLRSGFDIGLSCVFDLDSTENWQAMKDSTDCDITLSIGSVSTGGLEIDMPRVAWRSSAVDGNQNRYNTQQMQAIVYKTKGEDPLSITLTTSGF